MRGPSTASPPRTATRPPDDRAEQRTRLIVQADDFGMCHAVNEGVVRAFVEGILTQASMMVPCPWFAEAAALAKRHAIPVGMHSTLTCEWDAMRWRPLTHGASLVRGDGTFHETVERAARAALPGEAAAELAAQARVMVDHGLAPTYFDTHMGLVSTPAYEHVTELYERPFILPFVPRFLWLGSLLVLSPRPEREKRATLLDYIDTLPPGNHLIQTHPAVASVELRALVAPGSAITSWAEPYRTSDLALLVDAEVAERVEARGIELISVADLDPSAIASGWGRAPVHTSRAAEPIRAGGDR